MAMAFPPDDLPALSAPPTSTNAHQVGQYVINSKHVLGKGAFGTVTTATNTRNQIVAVKRLDGTDKRKLERLTKDLDKLLDLNHENLVEMFSVQQEDTTIWMFMYFCPHGDLGKFFTTEAVTDSEMLEIMTQVAMGIVYLHSRNVIHRDVKPSNILVSSVTPIVVKITDFDFCKFLEDGYDTSLLTTNVGTPAFKAPEFFQRTEAGQLRYHRTVDVYAAGLTFLAMVQKNKMLAPQIETPLEDSELWLPIGTIIAERIKYGKQPLEIVNIDGKQYLDKDLPIATADLSLRAESQDFPKPAPGSSTTHEVKRLVRDMTRVAPEDRLSASEVVLRLQALRSESPDPAAVTSAPASDHKIPEVKLDKVFTWEHGLYLSTTFTSGSYVIARGQMMSSYTSDSSIDQYIRVLNRDIKKVVCELSSECKHNFCPLLVMPARPDHVMEACKECEEIRCYHVNSKESDVILEECNVERFCVGPEGSMLICTAAGEVQQLTFKEGEEQPQVHHSIDVDVRQPEGVCYVDQLDAVVMTSQSPAHVRAVTLKNGFFLWKFTRKVDKLKLNCWGVTADNHGRIYVADGKNKRLLVLEVRRGRLLQVLDNTDSVQVYTTDTVLWNDTQPQLSVNDMWGARGDKVCLCNVTSK